MACVHRLWLRRIVCVGDMEACQDYSTGYIILLAFYVNFCRLSVLLRLPVMVALCTGGVTAVALTLQQRPSCGNAPAAKAAKYCNADCQKAHWQQRKAPCKAGTAEPAELPSQVTYNAALSEVKRQVKSDERYFAALVIWGTQDVGRSAGSMVETLSRLDHMSSSQEVAEREELVGRVRRGMMDELKDMRGLGRLQPDELGSLVLAGLMVGQKINAEAKAG